MAYYIFKRNPKNPRLCRMTSFNVQNVNMFFDKFAEVMDKYGFSISDIWNENKTGVYIVLKPNEIVAVKGKHNLAPCLLWNEKLTLQQ